MLLFFNVYGTFGKRLKNENYEVSYYCKKNEYSFFRNIAVCFV